MRKKRLVKSYQSSRVLSKKVNVSKRDNVLYLFSMAAVITLATLSITNLNKFFSGQKKISQQEVFANTESTLDERKFWEDFLENSPDYLPGIIELIKIEVREGNKENAVKLLEKAKSIDPNDEKVIEAGKLILNSKS